ncbi:hypothetical protein JOE09_003923 [Pantoea coffeiphila]|nr:hypothetical protein [Pantoea coffeiphila]
MNQGVGPASAAAGRSSRRCAVPSVTALCRADRPGLNIPVQARPERSIHAALSWHNAFTSALRIIRQPPMPSPSYSWHRCLKIACSLILRARARLFFQTGNATVKSRLAGVPNGQSAALNVARKPGFGHTDVAESHSRAGPASVAVRPADERSEGTAKRREDPPERCPDQSKPSPYSQTSRPHKTLGQNVEYLTPPALKFDI